MSNLPPILPVGTRVVAREDISNSSLGGVVGLIVHAPSEARQPYRIRFVDGAELTLRRDEFEVLSHHQFIALDKCDVELDLFDHVIYRCIVGSRAYGLEEDDSDTDRRGIYIPPADLHWSLGGVPDNLRRFEEQYWEIERFIVLALKANPNVLECLYTPLIEYASPLAQELLEMRSIFLSKLIYQTYNGYVMSQYRQIQKHVDKHQTIRWKHAMHLIRLLLSGIVALQQGSVQVRVEDHRDRLLAIRRGEIDWENVNAWRLALHSEFDEAYRHTRLPERPDYAKANSS